MIERIIYQCDYCKKRLMNKSQMFFHESQCWYKPENKTCLTCPFNEILYDTDNVNYRICNKDASIEFNSIKPKVNCPLWEEPNEINDPYEEFI